MSVLVKLLDFLLLSDSTPTISHKHVLQLKDLANKGKSRWIVIFDKWLKGFTIKRELVVKTKYIDTLRKLFIYLFYLK